VMFYIYLAVFFEMKTYVQDYPGVILRRDWSMVKFYNASVDRERDNFIEFEGDECTLYLNTNTKTNADGSAPRKQFPISGTRLAHFLKLWEPHAWKMQNQTFETKTKSITLQASTAYVVCHYSCKQTTTYGRPYTKKGDFYTAVKKSVLKYYPELEAFKECLNATAARKNDAVQASRARKRRFGDTVTSESIADERLAARRRLHSSATAHEQYEALS
jgi:hypothetical protein